MMNNICERLRNVDLHVIDGNYVNKVVGDVCDILINAAKTMFGTKKVFKGKPKPKCTYKKQWFKSARQNYRKLKDYINVKAELYLKKMYLLH